MPEDSNSNFDPEIRRAALRMEVSDDASVQKEKEYTYQKEKQGVFRTILNRITSRQKNENSQSGHIDSSVSSSKTLEEVIEVPAQEDPLQKIYKFDRDIMIEASTQLSTKLGIDLDQIKKYLVNRKPQLYEWKNFVKDCVDNVVPLQYARRFVELGGILDSTFQDFVLFNETRFNSPESIDILTHAQRRDHVFGLLTQIEKSKKLSDDTFALRSKEENNVRGERVQSFSHNGRGDVLQTGSREVSTNLNGVQNGYGEFVWITTAASLAENRTAVFTTTGSPTFHDGFGEIGIETSASQIIAEELKNNSDRTSAIQKAKEKISQNNISMGISLNNDHTFCLVPEGELPDVMTYIDAMGLASEDKLFLRQRFVAYKPESDKLGNGTVESLTAHPQNFVDLVRSHGGEISNQELNELNSSLSSINFKENPDGAGYVRRSVPDFRASNKEQRQSAMLLVLHEKDTFGLSSILEKIPDDLQQNLLDLVQLRIQKLQNQGMADREVISEIRKLSEIFQKKVEDLSEDDSVVLKSSFVQIESFDKNEDVLTGFMKSKFVFWNEESKN